jgi:N-acetyl-beta-hexosaminidase
MYLIPQPKSITPSDGSFRLSRDTSIVLDAGCSVDDNQSAFILKNEIRNALGLDLKVTKSFVPVEGSIYLKNMKGSGETYSLSILPSGIEIEGSSSAGLFYGVQTLRQILRNSPVDIPSMKIEDEPTFAHRGFYHDITRGKVPTLETLKELADRASFYKLNQLQLYIEHTFAFKKMSEVWTITDPLTPEDVLCLDEYCRKRNVELVPSLSTFGHLYHALSSNSFSDLCELENVGEIGYTWLNRQLHHTLDVSNPGSLKLVQDMLSEFIPLFSSDKFNICCDETFDLGQGKNKELAEKVGKGRLYVDFLNKIISYVKQYDKKVMFWGDIILKHPDLIDEIPKDVICLNWCYRPEPKEEDTKTISESGLSQYVCPGVWGWNSLMNNMEKASPNITNMITYGKRYGAVGVLNTDWGDFGHVNLFANSMPGMIYGASGSWSPDTLGDFKAADEAASFIEFGDRSSSTVGILRELSQLLVVNWGQIMLWKDRKYRNQNYVTTLDEELLRKSPEEIVECYNRSLEIGSQLLEISATVPENRKFDYQEFYIAAQGTALLDALILIIQKHDLGRETDVEILNPKELAGMLELWLADYKKIWRYRNKESELYRIRDAFIEVCGYLRRI